MKIRVGFVSVMLLATAIAVWALSNSIAYQLPSVAATPI
jgi:hypothetical protein